MHVHVHVLGLEVHLLLVLGRHRGDRDINLYHLWSTNST
jgi:hypothetical protein